MPMSLRCILPAALVLLALIPGLTPAANPQPVLVKNINTVPVAEGVIPDVMVAAGNRVFFTAHAETLGDELFVSDGTVKGTRLVKDIHPGPGTSRIHALTTSGGKAFFSANDGVHGDELWVSDGTEKGTRMVADLVLGSGSGTTTTAIHPYGKGVVFFSKSEGEFPALWWTDGTGEGTRLLKTLTHQLGPSAQYFVSAGLLGSQLYLHFYENETRGACLWKTDGTAAGTVLVKAFPDAEPYSHKILGIHGKHLYLNSGDAVTGSELWKTDGTEAGTVLVKDIRPGAGSSSPSRFFSFNKKAVFEAYTPENGMELWSTDGTTEGTRLFHEDMEGPESNSPWTMVALGQLLLQENDYGLRSLNVQTGDIKQVADASIVLTLAGTKAYFAAYHEDKSRLFVTNGTAAGTRMVTETVEVDGSMVAAGSQVFFIGSEGGGPLSLWKSNGTRAGTPPC